MPACRALKVEVWKRDFRVDTVVGGWEAQATNSVVKTNVVIKNVSFLYDMVFPRLAKSPFPLSIEPTTCGIYGECCPFGGANISDAIGITEARKATLKSLEAMETIQNHSLKYN